MTYNIPSRLQNRVLELVSFLKARTKEEISYQCVGNHCFLTFYDCSMLTIETLVNDFDQREKKKRPEKFRGRPANTGYVIGGK